MKSAGPIVSNRGYAKMLWEIHRLMVNDQITRDFEDYLAVTDDDKVAAAVLALASVIRGDGVAAVEEPKKDK